jgi:hypothetical protein
MFIPSPHPCTVELSRFKQQTDDTLFQDECLKGTAHAAIQAHRDDGDMGSRVERLHWPMAQENARTPDLGTVQTLFVLAIAKGDFAIEAAPRTG